MLSLFVVALASATLLPGGSEVWLARQWCQGEAVGLLWAVATLGNTLGSLVNVALGRYARHLAGRRWFPVSAPALARGERTYARLGRFSLLLAWLPVVGDALTVVAGLLRLPFGQATLLILAGKGARYAVVLWLAEHWLGGYCQ